MPFTTYTELQDAIKNWLARDDLAIFIPDFIRLFEAVAGRKLKVRPQETVVTLTPVSGVATLPSDYLGYKRVTWTGSTRRELTYVVPTVFQSDYPEQPSGVPSEFTIEGSSLKVAPLSDSPIELLYSQRTAALSSALNWLYTNHYDVYLFGSLCEANAFDKAIDAAGLWKGRRDEGFDEIGKLDFNERSNMRMRVVGSATP